MKAEWHAFQSDCASFGLFPDEAILEKLDDYLRLLCEYNRHMNLTAITDTKQIYKLHFTDSLALLKNASFAQRRDLRLIDIGSGAGFPGMVLKLFCPQWRVVLLDAQKKRVDFLNKTADLLFADTVSRETVTAIHGRAEELGHDPSYRAAFDLGTARAVSHLRVLAEYALPLLKTDGVFAAYKTTDTAAELSEAQNAMKTLGGSIVTVDDYTLPDTDIGRRIIYIQKVSETDQRYPRRAGMPEKKPL